jgi:hypothetical protein
MTELAFVIDATIGMALFAVNHLHSFLAVTGEPIFLVDWEHFFFGYVPMALDAFNSFSLVGSMRKVNVVGLPGINPPWDFLVLLDVILNQLALILGIPHGRLMAFLAFLRCGNPGKGPIRSESVTIFTTAVLVGSVAKIHGLSFLGIEEVGKDDPANDQRKYETCKKDDPSHYTFTGSAFVLFFHRLASVAQSFGDPHQR